jgi:hypothetical protein
MRDLDAMPARARIEALIGAVLADNAGAASSVAALITVATSMANRLLPEQRRALAVHMIREAQGLDPTAWN